MGVAAADPEWAIGFEDECWWSRVASPTLSSWTEEGKPLRLVRRSVPKNDPEPKAVSCYGLYLPGLDDTWLRFVDGRPMSSITTQFLSWCCEKLQAAGKKVLLLIWDNASWYVSREVRRWLGRHNREAKERGEGVRIVSCLLPKQSPWLNAIEPKWVHGKRKVVETNGLLGAYELADRVCRVFDCPHYEHLSVPRKVVRSCIRYRIFGARVNICRRPVGAENKQSFGWGRVHRVIFFVWAAILSLLFGITFVRVTALTIGLWLANQNRVTNPVTDFGYFTLGAFIITTGFVVQLRAPEHKIDSVQQVVIGLLALGVAGLIGGRVEPLTGSLLSLVASAMLVALHPARREFFRAGTHPSPRLYGAFWVPK